MFACKPPALGWQSASVTQRHQPGFCRKGTQAVRLLPSRNRQVAYSRNSSTPPAEMTSNLEQVLFVESGFGCDQHGQNATVRLPRSSCVLYFYLLR